MVFVSAAEGGPVGRGTYWSFGSGELVRLREEGVLPGPPSRRWIKLPAVLLLLLGPVLGLVFVMFLPVAGIALMVYLPAQAIWQKITGRRDDDREGAPSTESTAVETD